MAYFDFPHTRNYDTDLGYLIKKLQEIETTVNEFSSVNEIKYHDPIQWDISTQYTTNTIVVDGYNTYLSKQPVPSGIDITNTNYWLKVADFSGYIKDYKQFITYTDLGNSDITLKKLSKDELIIYNDELYVVTTDISADTKIIVGTNIIATDINSWVLTLLSTVYDSENKMIKFRTSEYRTDIQYIDTHTYDEKSNSLNIEREAN